MKHGSSLRSIAWCREISMRAQINNAVVVGPRRDFTSNREIPVVGDNGANASVRTTRGGIIVRPNDFQIVEVNPSAQRLTGLRRFFSTIVSLPSMGGRFAVQPHCGPGLAIAPTGGLGCSNARFVAW